MYDIGHEEEISSDICQLTNSAEGSQEIFCGTSILEVSFFTFT